MKETLSAYWQFLKQPRLLKLSKNKSNLWKDILYLILLDFLFCGLILLTYSVLLNFNLIKKYEEFDLFKFGFPVAMLLGCVFAPIFEEFIFRWQLRKRKLSVYFLMISFGLLIASFVTDDYAKFFIIIGIVIIFIVGIIVMDKLNKKQSFQVWKIYYVILFYYTALIFGYVHISNIKGLGLSDPSFVLYISSQVFGGLTLGYIRIKYGLKYSMLMHACLNFVLVPLAWFIK